MIALWNGRLSTDVLLLFVNVLIQSTILTAAALVGARLFRRRATFRHCILLSALLSLMVIPVLAVALCKTSVGVVSIPLSSKPADRLRPAVTLPSITPDRVPASTVEQFATTDNTSEPSSIRAETASAAPAPAVAHQRDGDESSVRRNAQGQLTGIAFPAVWALGTLVALWGIVRGTWKLQRLIAHSQPCAPHFLVNVVEHAARALSIASLPPIVCSPDMNGPAVAGIVRPSIILPNGLIANLTVHEQRNLLLHELAHVLRRDCLVLLVQQLVAAMYWLNPLVYVLNRELARAREEICDNYVLSRVAPRAYGETLLHLGQILSPRRVASPTLGMLNNYWTLEDRIVGLLDERRDTMTRLQVSYSIGILVSAFGISLVIAGNRVVLAQVGSEHAAKTAIVNVDVVDTSEDEEEVMSMATVPFHGFPKLSFSDVGTAQCVLMDGRAFLLTNRQVVDSRSKEYNAMRMVYRTHTTQDGQNYRSAKPVRERLIRQTRTATVGPSKEMRFPVESVKAWLPSGVELTENQLKTVLADSTQVLFLDRTPDFDDSSFSFYSRILRNDLVLIRIPNDALGRTTGPEVGRLRVPAGYHVFSVKVPLHTPEVQLGDRISVGTKASVKPLVEDVTVLSVDSEKLAVSVFVKPEDAERIIVAGKQNELTMSVAE